MSICKSYDDGDDHHFDYEDNDGDDYEFDDDKDGELEHLEQLPQWTATCPSEHCEGYDGGGDVLMMVVVMLFWSFSQSCSCSYWSTPNALITRCP